MSDWTNRLKEPIEFLTQESAITDFLLLETGDKIILEQTGNSQNLWTNRTKN